MKYYMKIKIILVINNLKIKLFLLIIHEENYYLYTKAEK